MSPVIVALLGATLLADAAVETFAGGSPVRWWAVGATVLYALTTVATWRRALTWRGRLTIALAFVLGLIAVTAWLTGGLTDGIRALGQTTPRIVAALVAGGVAIGCLAIVRETRVPLAVRVTIGALASYGTAAFAAGALGRVPLVELLSGASLWQRLPAVFQGAFVGGLVILPLALVVSVVRTGVRRPRGASAHAEIWRLTANATSLAMVLAAIPWPPHPRAGVTAGGPAAGVEAPLGRSKLSAAERNAALANSLRAVEDGEREAARDRWDPAYVRATLGPDPRRSFDWVRRNTSWIPYHGLLRGPAGVLMDRLGDNLDRAVLLATLLDSGSGTVRLAHGSLSHDQAARLLPRVLAARARAPHGAAPAMDDAMTAVARQYQLNAASLKQTLGSQAEAHAAKRALLQARVPEQTRRLSAALDGRSTDRLRENIDRAIEALQDHWWVQVRDGDSWRDFDLLGDSDGTALLTPADTFDPASLPVTTRHTIVVRVVTEQWSGGALSERVPLEQAIDPAALVGTPLSLQFVPLRPPTRPPLTDLASRQALKSVALEQHEWAPILAIGTRVIAQSAFLDTGELTKPGAEELLRQSGRDANAFARSALEAFGASPAPAAPQAHAAPTILTAAWLEYEFRAPGAPARISRRAVFDLIGPAARASAPVAAPTIDEPAALARSLALMMGTEMLPVVCRFAPEFLVHLAARSLLDNRDLLGAVVRREIPDDFAHAQDVAKRIAPLPTPLYGMAHARFDWSPFADDIYIDRPNLFTRHLSFEPDAQGFVLRDATDIVANDVGVDLAASDPPAIRLAQGVLDTNAEAILASDKPDATNAGWAFETGEWTTVTSASDPQLATLRLPNDVRHRIADDLAAGLTVVAPRAPVSVAGGTFAGWWRIDRTTGQTIGMGSTGWGTSMAERAVLLLSASAAAYLFSYTLCRISQTGPAADRRSAGSSDERLAALDYFIVPVHAIGSSGCIDGAIEAAVFAFVIGLGGMWGGGGGGPNGGRGGGGGGGRGGSGGGGGGGQGPGGVEGGGEGSGTGGNSANGGSGGGGEGGEGAGGSGGGGVSENPAMDDAFARADAAWARRDWNGWVEAMRDAYRAQTGLTQQLRDAIPPKGTPTGPPPPGWPAKAGTSEVSPGAISVRPCDLGPCASPMAKSVGGIGGTLDVVNKGGGKP